MKFNFWPFNTHLNEKEKKDRRRSWVRVIITYVAAIYLFGGSGYLIYYFMMCTFSQVPENMKQALTVFNTTLPIATGIITYWFAARSNTSGSENGSQS